jgi:hypothetical protein
VQRGSSCAKLATWISSEVIEADVPEVDFGERHGLSGNRRLAIAIHRVNEYAHPLIARAVRVDCTPRLAGSLDLDSFTA